MYVAHDRETNADYLGPPLVSCPVLKFVESWSNCLSMVMETHILTYAGSHSFLPVVHETMLSLYFNYMWQS